MNIDFQGQRLPLQAALKDHARRRVDVVLMHRGESIERIVICIGGANGGSDYKDMYCLMQVHLPGALVATVVDIGPDIHDVIDRATDRVDRIVGALLARVEHKRRNVESSANTSPRQKRAGISCAERARPLSRSPRRPDPVANNCRAAGRIVEIPIVDGN